MADNSKGRIAFKLSTSVSSSSAAPPSSLGKRRRQGAFATDHDSDSDHHDERPVVDEFITGFSAAGAETKSSERSQSSKRNLVIPRQSNHQHRDWRDEHKARRESRNPLPGEEGGDKRRRPGAIEREPADDDKDVQWGLTVREKRAVVENYDGDDDDDDDDGEARPHETSNTQNPNRTADDKARDAAYRRDIVSLGAPSTLEDYEAMPVEEFGAALLRGMGWDGVPRGPKPNEIRNRPNRLGLGATAKGLKDLEDLQGWNQAPDRKKRPRLDQYRRDESRRKEGRRHEDSFKRERDRERDGYRDGVRGATSDRVRHRH